MFVWTLAMSPHGQSADQIVDIIWPATSYWFSRFVLMGFIVPTALFGALTACWCYSPQNSIDDDDEEIQREKDE